MDWLVGWDYRKLVTLSRASGAVTNYQLKILIGESSGAAGADVHCEGHVLSSFNDLRFTNSDGQTLLSYWIESISGTTPNQLATVWVEFDSIGTAATTFCMYYGNSGASSYSNIQTTFIAGDNGVAGNFTEAVDGTAIISHGSGKYTITEDSTDDAALSGVISADLNFEMRVVEFQGSTGITTAQHDNFFGIFDSTTISVIIGTAAEAVAKARFWIERFNSNSVSTPDYFYVVYQDTIGDYYRWNDVEVGPGWVNNPSAKASSGNLELKIWSDGTNVYCDVLQGGTTVFLTVPTAVPISSIKAISNGIALVWGEPFTDAYGITQSIDDYYVRQFRSPEPIFGSWGAETIVSLFLAASFRMSGNLELIIQSIDRSLAGILSMNGQVYVLREIMYFGVENP